MHFYANKINLIRCSNITDNDATVTIDVEKGGTHKMIAIEITVPANSSVDIIDKNSSFYLEETDLIRGGASAARGKAPDQQSFRGSFRGGRGGKF